MIIKKVRTAMKVFRGEGCSGLVRIFLSKIVCRSANLNCGPVQEIWNEYMQWLTFANAGMLTTGNVYSFNYVMQNLPSDAPIIEIGSFCGLSANMLTYLKEKNGVKNKLITCDRWIFEGGENGGALGDSRGLSHADYSRFVKESFVRNVKMFSRDDLPFAIERFSDEFFQAWAEAAQMNDVLGREITLGGKISFCYIDGNHSYDYAKRDFENCDKYLEIGGFVLFDDSADGSDWGVCEVVKDVASTGRYELVANNPNYLFRKTR